MVIVEVCVGSACHLKGSYDIISSLQNLIEKYQVEEQVDIKAAFCLGNCAHPVSIKFEGEDMVYSVQTNTVKQFFETEILRRANHFAI